MGFCTKCSPSFLLILPSHHTTLRANQLTTIRHCLKSTFSKWVPCFHFDFGDMRSRHVPAEPTESLHWGPNIYFRCQNQRGWAGVKTEEAWTQYQASTVSCSQRSIYHSAWQRHTDKDVCAALRKKITRSICSQFQNWCVCGKFRHGSLWINTGRENGT